MGSKGETVLTTVTVILANVAVRITKDASIIAEVYLAVSSIAPIISGSRVRSLLRP